MAGLVLFRRRAATASGTIFVTLEDETGSANLIVWPNIPEKFRKAVFGGKLLACVGTLQREGHVIHVIAKSLHDWFGRGVFVLYVFDLLYLDGLDLRPLPLIQRKALLAPIVASADIAKYSEHFEDSAAFFQAACSIGAKASSPRATVGAVRLRRASIRHDALSTALTLARPRGPG